MKLQHWLLFPLLALFALTFQSCLKDSCERQVSYTRLEPVYKTFDEIHNGTIVNEAPRQLKNPGQIYYYNNYLFVNERKEGIHVIDNSDPTSPQNIAFINIPGNEDLAIRNGILYANSYIDLLAIDIQNVSNTTILGRTKNVFPPIWEDIANNQVLVDYVETPITEVMDCETFGALYKSADGRFFELNGGVSIDVLANFDQSIAESSTGAGTGVGGSMARFSAIGDYLYVVDQFSLKVFDLNNPIEATLANTVNIGWGIETIFPYEDKLFIGSNSGMFIFDNSNPTAPTQLAAFQHARACDPVFVNDKYAYVTLRSGTACDGFNNQLDVIDISNITNPVLEKTFPMDNPHGLSIKDNTLVLCEGDFGVKTFDVTQPLVVGEKLLGQVKNIHAFDVISLPGAANIAMVIGEDGFYQYSFEDPSDLKLLSKISVVK